MYLTQTQIINLNLNIGQAQIESDRLKDLIKRDQASKEKLAMKEGVKYYNNENDILERKKYYWMDGLKVEDQADPNIREPHPFMKILTDQSADYIVGKEPNISVETDQYKDELDKYLTDKFYDQLNDWVKNSSKKAIEWFHVYINPESELKTVIVPAEEIIPVWDTQYKDKLVGVIRYYEYTFIKSNNEHLKRYKVEWWEENTVTYYIQLENETFILDNDYEANPAPHFQLVNQSTNEVSGGGWGRVPFIPLFNNSEMKTDLHPIKKINDSYDLVKSGWINDLETFNELLYVIKGYNPMTTEARKGLSELRVFIDSIKQDKGVATDEKGGVDVVRSEIPVDAKEKFLDITRKEIFYFGQGVDVSNDVIGNAPSGVSLQFQYAPLDMKADAKIRKLRPALTDYFWFITEYINRNNRTSYNVDELEIKFNKSMIFNIKETVETINSADISHETKLELYPMIENVELEKERYQSEKQDEIDNILNELGNEPTE